MNCLCCGKPLEPNTEHGWHDRCIKKFFGTTKLPLIELDEESLSVLVEKSTDKGFTVPGVQKKLSLHLHSGRGQQPRLTLVDYPTGYILKPQVEAFKALPESEHLVMQMAARVGIKTVPHALIKAESGYAFITKRVDRIKDKGGTKKLAMEDFCQLDERLTQDKYKGSYERCAKLIKKYSSIPALDMAELFLRLVFSFAVGNSDMHLKNFSLIETAPESGVYVLSPAYDLLPVNLVMPEDKEQFALPMNGKKANLRRKDFLIFADNTGIPEKAANDLLGSVVAALPGFIADTESSLLPDDMKAGLIALMEDRCGAIKA
ncbi:MAG: HipA domain-containing protein [Clostridia bacterium]|nr:HipA domain-containing protein [Clostridia bacterium]